MSARSLLASFVAAFLALRPGAFGQQADPVRVTVSMNADGSKTIYEFDAPQRKATATTTGKDGKLVGKVRYTLDDAGRFSSGEVYGPDDRLRFKTLYKYDTAGRLTQETQLDKDDAVKHKLVYFYDGIGRQVGYKVYDAAGKLVTQKGKVAPSATPSKKRR
jgi:YD repeat-containing protein